MKHQCFSFMCKCGLWLFAGSFWLFVGSLRSFAGGLWLFVLVAILVITYFACLEKIAEKPVHIFIIWADCQ